MLYVIKIFTNDWFSSQLVSNSLPTKENRVGGIFIIGIIKQNAVFLAIFCNCAQKCYYTLQQQCSVTQVLHLDNTWTPREAMGWKESHCPCMGMICVFCSIILHVRKNPPTTISKICGEYGQKSSSTPIVRVYFDNIGSWNHGTCFLCARGNFDNLTQFFFLVNLFTRQMWERAGVRSVRQRSVIGLKWFPR